MFRKIPFHPILLSIYPILFLYSNNINLVNIQQLYFPVLWSVIGATILWLLLNLLLKNPYKSSIITSVISVLFFSYGHIIRVLNSFPENTLGIGSDLYLFINYIIIIFIVVYFIVKFLKIISLVTGFLNFFSLVLIIYPLAVVFLSLDKTNTTYSKLDSEFSGVDTIIQKTKGIKKPDIYYIILDGYGRNDVLKNVYNYDNNDFINELEKRHFFIARKSCSNYSQTLLSLASSLNMEYLDSKSMLPNIGVTYRQYLSSKIIDNKVVNILHRIGYKFVTFSSGYSGTEIKNSDNYFSPKFSPDEFENMLIATTPIYSLLQLLTSYSGFYIHRQRIIYTLNEIPKVKINDSPFFLFAHVVSPHPPFVFANDNETPKTSNSNQLSFLDGYHYHSFNDSLQEQYKIKYILQLKKINNLVLKMIDDLLANKGKNSIIILQSDHGPGALLNWEFPDPSTYSERMPILNAYYFPEISNPIIYNSITPVNSFRLIFNKYFNFNLKLLDNKSYFSRWSKPYEFIDVNNSLIN